MNTGIQDGYNLAWKLALACKGKAGPKLLDTYNEERLPNARRLLQTTDRLFQFGASDEWFISYVRTHIFPYVIGFALNLDVVKNAIFPLVSQIGISYRDSSLSRDDAGFAVRAGMRMPYFKMGHSIYDSLREPKFHLIAFGGEGAGGVVDGLKDIVDTHTLPLTDDVLEHFGADRPFVALLRPDNYIGLISTDVSLESVRMYLGEILGKHQL